MSWWLDFEGYGTVEDIYLCEGDGGDMIRFVTPDRDLALSLLEAVKGMTRDEADEKILGNLLTSYDEASKVDS